MGLAVDSTRAKHRSTRATVRSVTERAPARLGAGGTGRAGSHDVVDQEHVFACHMGLARHAKCAGHILAAIGIRESCLDGSGTDTLHNVDHGRAEVLCDQAGQYFTLIEST